MAEEKGALIVRTEALGATLRFATALAKNTVWKAALDGVTATDAVLVRRVDRPDDYYYVVTLARGETPTARMAVSAHNAELLRCHGISKTQGKLTRWVRPEAALKAREGRRLDVANPARSIIIRATTTSIHPTLVWRPCAASTSPLLPFHVLIFGDTVAYLRVDGRWYERLMVGPSGR